MFDSVDALRWQGPTPAFAVMAARFDAAITADLKVRPTP
jgi:hypothetical protein